MSEPLQRLSVVVPVGPGDRLAAPLKQQLQHLPHQAQVLIVCADAEYARTLGRECERDTAHWQCVESLPGRALQQNAGAQRAERDWLWFVHADSVLDETTLPALSRFIARDDDALGYFDLRFLDDGPPTMRLNAAGVWLRSHGFGLPFGDQALLLRRQRFEQFGGFDPAIARGEDHALVWRAHRARLPVRAIGATVCTSARRYAQHGWLQTTLRHLRETWQQARRFSREPSR